ncbi:helix-turn-helix domain-containing protein [Pseudokineococcus sp. 1T1Z-3]|uniref:helix-turn-helix domain-containing protein n=1 Tax=Pseudokineococcus sp. 1T1Z-3 TaxID=3132745 RepID=UPI00403F7F73
MGAFLREQRQLAQLSLRQLAAAAGVSNPYLSQVERGLRRPSAEVLQQIARGLRISAEALYVRAGILQEHPGEGDVRAALLADPHLSERQRQVVLEIYATFRAENARAEVPPASGAGTPGAERDPPDLRRPDPTPA